MTTNVAFCPVDVLTKTIEKASATVIAAKTWVALDRSKLAIPAVATSAALGYCPVAVGDGDLEVLVWVDPRIIFESTADAVFAESMRGTEVDLVGTTTSQLVDVGASATDVFKMSFDKFAGTVGSTAKVQHSINKPL